MATILVHVALGWLCLLQVTALAVVPALSDERVVFQTKYGDIELAFYPEVPSSDAAQKQLWWLQNHALHCASRSTVNLCYDGPIFVSCKSSKQN